MPRAFISYSHKDKEYAHKLADELSRNKIEVWIDDRIDYGAQWPHVIQSNLEGCPIFILLMSAHSYRSTWVQNELAFAQLKGKAIYPLLLEGEGWLSVASIQYADVRNGQLPPEQFIRAIREMQPVAGSESHYDPRCAKREEIVNVIRQNWRSKGSFLEAGLYTLICADQDQEYSILAYLQNDALLRQYNPTLYTRYRAIKRTIQNDDDSLGVRSASLKEEAKLKEENNFQLHWEWDTFPDQAELELVADALLEAHEKLKIPLEKISIRRSEKLGGDLY